ncbi:MAG TPA: prepilin-type N-terminal cleavage/methylation domain-containing protein [Candidatus Portnoybacteria bacterium]|nr:prepilin-type N-terminal cleavage/methylation domain-containing protein [Candidatus Portnoybacteria bacterium]
MKQKYINQQGMGIIEILVVVAIIGVSLASLAGLGNFALKVQRQLKQNTIASFLASEEIEAARAIKDGQWSALASLATETPMHPAKSPSSDQWIMEGGEETLNGFTRQIIISNVYRDGSFNIASGGGTLDASTKKITATVSWSDNGQNKQITLVDYLMDWQP